MTWTNVNFIVQNVHDNLKVMESLILQQRHYFDLICDSSIIIINCVRIILTTWLSGRLIIHKVAGWLSRVLIR